MDNTWFENWDGIIRILLTTPLAYFSMVFLLRMSGKRTLSKMNAFDFVVTIALGSILAAVALNKDIPLANGVAAILAFIALQFLFTWLSVRTKAFKSLITSRPTLIFYKGKFLHKAMKDERITVDEIYSAARQQGMSSLKSTDVIILETTGDISIVEKMKDEDSAAFEDVRWNLK